MERKRKKRPTERNTGYKISIGYGTGQQGSEFIIREIRKREKVLIWEKLTLRKDTRGNIS
jgi:hypothetical protein